MDYLKKYWYWIIGVFLLAVGFYYMMANRLTAPAGVPDPEQWLSTYKIELQNAEPFSEGEMANREKYEWNLAQHKHNKAVWQTNKKLGTNVNAKEWNWPA